MNGPSQENPPTKTTPSSISRHAKRIAKCIALVLVFQFIGIAAVCAVAFLKPALLFNERTLAFSKRAAATFDIALDWDQLKFSADKPSLWIHHVSWNFDHLSVTAPSLPLHFSADHFAGQFNLVWNLPEFPRFVHIENLGTWKLTGGNLTVGPFNPSDSGTSNFDVNHMELPWILERATIAPSTFIFDNIHLQLAELTFEGPLQLLVASSLAQETQDERFKQRLTLTVQDVDQTHSSVCWTDLTGAKPPSKRQCLDRLSVSAALGTRDGIIRVAQVGPISLHATNAYLRFSAEDKVQSSSSEPSSDKPIQIPSLISEATLAKIDVRIAKSSLKMSIGGDPWSVNGDLDVAVADTSNKPLTTFEDLNVRAKSANLCTTNPYLDGCLQMVELSARIGRKTRESKAEVLSIQKALVTSRNLTVLLPEETPRKKTTKTAPASSSKNKAKPQPEAPAFDWQRIPFEHQDSKHYSIKIDQFRVLPVVEGKRQKNIASGSVSASLNTPRGAKTDRKSEWNIQTRITPPGNVRLLMAEMRLATGGFPLELPPSMVLRTQAFLKTGEKVTLALAGRRDTVPNTTDMRVILEGNINAENIKGIASPGVTIRGTINPNAARLTLDGNITVAPKLTRIVLPNITNEVACNQEPPPGPNLDLSAIGLTACSVDLNYSSGFDHSKFDLRCPIHLDALLTSPEAEAHQQSRSMSIDLTTDAHVEGVESIRFSDNLGWQGQANIAVARHNFGFTDGWLNLQANIHGAFLTSQKNPALDLTWNTHGGLDFDVKKFSALVKLLEHLPYAVTSPFNILEGNAAFSATFAGNSQSERMDIPFSLKTALKSTEQRLYAHADGIFQMDNIGDKSTPLQTNTNLKLALDDIGLTLPHVSIREKFPMLFPDRRIDVGTCSDTAKPDEKSTASFDISVATATSKPIRITTNLTKEVIPILINGHFTDKNGLAGDLNVNEFEFEVFRRKADVKSFNITIDPDNESPVVDGNLEFKYTDITINLLIGGTVDEPIITFESNPIRSEREIIAMLLYGQDASSFDDDQMQTADDLSAAFADQMIGLASLFMLAKTPVESVHYNPATKAFNAKVRLDTNTSLNLGTTSDAERSVGVRHRLSSTWSVQTDVSKDDQTETTSGTALLEWSKRF